MLILCYHGFSRSDEHLWSPHQHVTADHLEARLRFLDEAGYRVLPLAEGLHHLAEGSLPERAVALTVDDGTYDFYAVAYPILLRRMIPFTVFVPTYYVFDRRPVFDGAASYLLWKAASAGACEVPDPAGGAPLTISQPGEAHRVAGHIRTVAIRERWSAQRKNEWLAELAVTLGIDWQDFVRSRYLTLMNPEEVSSLDPTIADVQLHTHRHRVPEDRELFLREIHDNRNALAECGFDPAGRRHFCYPSGVHRPRFLPWLREAGVVSAVTGRPGLASRRDPPLLLPRFMDTATTSEVEFEGWTSGFRQFVHRPTRAFSAEP